MGHPNPAPDRLVALIAGRALTPLPSQGKPQVGLAVNFSSGLPTDLRADLEAEALELSARRGSGLLVPRGVVLDASGLAVTIELDPFDGEAIRLDSILGALDASGSAFGSPLSALLAGAVAARLRGLHAEGRAHGDLSPRQVLVGPGGGVALVAPGLPLLRSLLLPPEPVVDRARRRAPECLLGRPESPRSDVYGLGALYFELLAGVPYRARAGFAALRGAAQAALPPELPGSLPDPRAALLAFLGRCLGPSPGGRPDSADGFLAGLKEELASSRIPLADRATLATLLQEYVPDDAPRGPELFVTEGAPPGEPSRVGEGPPRAGSGLGWASILGESADLTDPELAPASTPAEPEPSRSPVGVGLSGPSLPVDPETRPMPAAATSSGPWSSGLRLPPASAGGAPAHVVRAPFSPEPIGAELGALEAPRAPGPPPTLDDAMRLSPKALFAGGAMLFAVLGLVVGIALLRDPGRAPEPVSRALVPAPADAGSSSERAPADGGSSAAEVGSGRTAGRTPAPSPSPPAPPEPKPLGLVSIMSKPSGAMVEIDGGYVGTTPLVLRHDLDERSAYTITISAEGHAVWKRRVRPKLGSISVVADLEPLE